MKTYSTFFLIFVTSWLGMVSCCNNKDIVIRKLDKSIVILHDNDVHCGIDNNGYSRIAGLRNAINASDTAQAIIVSSGDFIQGAMAGVLSQGSYIIDIMDQVGYSAVTIGNHEFDYKVPRQLELLNRLGPIVTCANFSDLKTGRQFYKPYIMTDVGENKIAFVGAVTPDTETFEFYAFYDSLGNKRYKLHANEVYNLIQNAVNDARGEGADYVLLLSHMGEKKALSEISSVDMIHNIYGVDAVLDGHTHSIIKDSLVSDKTGKMIHLTQTGTSFANIGRILIDKDGRITSDLIPTEQVPYSDAKVDEATKKVKYALEKKTSDTLGYADVELTINDEQGKRLVRCGETNAGDFVADALRYVFNADIGLQNGGAVRTNIPAGPVTYGALLNMSPFLNDLALREISGENIVGILEDTYKSVPEENGAFSQVSGIKLTIDCKGEKNVVKDVMVLNKVSGQYEPVDLNKKYLVAVNSYFVSMSAQLFVDSKDLTPKYISDFEATKLYLVDGLKGRIDSTYEKPKGRITRILK